MFYVLKCQFIKHESHVTRAQEHIAQLKSGFQMLDDKVDLTPVFEEFKTEVFFEGKQATVDMALANTELVYE